MSSKGIEPNNQVNGSARRDTPVVSTPLADPALAEHATAIRKLGKATVENIIEIGRRLTECRRIAGHGNWLPWLKREFGWTDETAYRFIRLAELSEQIPQIVDFDLPVSALYLLAAPSTPAEAREEIIERAQAGETIPGAAVKEIIKTAKGGKQPRNHMRAQIYREMKLGADLLAKIEGTSLDTARELDELITLDRGALPGVHAKAVEQLVAAAVAGEQVSAVEYTKSGAAGRREDVDSWIATQVEDVIPDGGAESVGENALLRARVDELAAEKRQLEIKIEGLEVELLVAPSADDIEKLKTEKRQRDETIAALRRQIIGLKGEIADLKAAAGVAAKNADGLDIPPFLCRAPLQLLDQLEQELRRIGVDGVAADLHRIRDRIERVRPQIDLTAVPAIGSA